MKHLLLCFVACLLGACHPTSRVAFTVRFDETVRDRPADGRLIIALAADSARIPPGTSTLDAPFWDDEQPVFGLDVYALRPGCEAVVGDSADAANTRLVDLSPGHYRATARMIVNRSTSSWRRGPGNLYSDEASFTIEPGKPLRAPITLNHRTEPSPWPTASPGVELFEMRSNLLSNFHGRDVMLRAGVVFPAHYDPRRYYAATYFVPGFGGDHTAAQRMARTDVAGQPDAADQELARETFVVVLDPESPNGHTLYANSANNGPCGDAIVRELMPALEAEYSLLSDAPARLLRGHSSGGWTVLWLALQYPETFGAAWSSSPDPIDFRSFEMVNIYEDNNMFTHAAPGVTGRIEFPSFRGKGEEVMTVRQEATGERVFGPNQTSGQPWHSWMACFGPRVNGPSSGAFNPAALLDPVTGRIDRTVAESYRRYDLGHLLRTRPKRFASIWRDRIRLVVGGEDSFYLEQAVQLLAADFQAITTSSAEATNERAPRSHGYIRVVPGCDHGSVFVSSEIRAFPQERLDHLRRSGCLSRPHD